MDENDAPIVRVETTRNGTVVTVNGKPVTAPLTRREAIEKAEKVQEALEPSRANISGIVFGILVMLAAVVFMFYGAFTNDWQTALKIAGFGFFGALIMAMWVFITKK